jgi:excinuclease ABC subunit C
VFDGKMVGEKIYKIKGLADIDDNEILSSFIKQHYIDQILLPKEILLPHSIDDVLLISDWLSKKKKGRVRIEIPSRGKKKDLVRMAEENANFVFENRIG